MIPPIGIMESNKGVNMEDSYVSELRRSNFGLRKSSGDLDLSLFLPNKPEMMGPRTRMVAIKVERMGHIQEMGRRWNGKTDKMGPESVGEVSRMPSFLA